LYTVTEIDVTFNESETRILYEHIETSAKISASHDQHPWVWCCFQEEVSKLFVIACGDQVERE
jgi:hypothetical protein